MPADELEEIPLAPVNESDEQRRKRLRSEDIALAARVDHETREAPDAPASSSAAAAESAMPAPRGDSALDVEEEIIRYVMAMRDSRLGEAEDVATRLRRAGRRARQEIERMQLDEVPPAGLEGIPPGLLKGFLRTLGERLG
ncbi:MAG TPA: hypothetical protein VGM03_19525 [Phycisphaerae bacterium]